MAHKATLHADPDVVEIFAMAILSKEDFYSAQFSSSYILRYTCFLMIHCLAVKDYYYSLIVYLQIIYYFDQHYL